MTAPYNLTLTADGFPSKLSLGAYRFIVLRKVTGTLEVSFDGQNWVAAQQNDRFGPLEPNPGNIYFRATNGVAAVVNFLSSLEPITIQDTATSVASTKIFGNLGIATGAAATGALPACSALGFLQITNAMNLLVSGTKDGKRRLDVTFCVKAGTAINLNVLDADGFAFMTIPSGATIQKVMDADFYLSGAGGLAEVTVGQVFLKN